MEIAYKKAVDYLVKKGIQLDQVIPINFGRYMIVKTMDNNNYLIMYKRDFYWTFGSEFADEGESGIGESVNSDNLREAVSRGVRNILIVYQNGNMYSISVEKLLDNAHRRTNHEGKDTLSFNLKWLTKECSLINNNE